MRRRARQLVFVGIYNSVVALDSRDGAEVWRTKVGGMSLVNVHWDGTDLLASSKGEVYSLDPESGAVRWHNKLKGLGTGVVTLATTRAATVSSAPVAAAAQEHTAHHAS